MTATKGLGTYGNGVGTVTPLDHKMANTVKWVHTASNTIRAGLVWDGNATIVSGKANMSYDVRALGAVLTRSSTAGAVELTNDAVYNVVTTAAPGSNSRYDVVYLWQREYSLDGTDSNPVIGVVQGTAAASPTVPSLAAFPGAIELARILVPAGVTATNSGTTITQTAPFTAPAGAKVVVRTTAERDAWTTALTDQMVFCLSNSVTYRWNGSAWKPWETASPVSYYSAGNLVNYTVATDTPLLTWSARAGRILVEVKVVITSGGGFSGTFQILLPFAAAAKYATSSAQWPVGGGHYLQPAVNAHRFDVVISGATLDRVTPVLLGAAGTYVSPGAGINGSTPVAQSAGYQVTAILEYDPA